MVSGVVNKHFKMWLWILIGLNIITKVHGYGDGLFNDTRSCQSMLVTHLRDDKELRPQDTELPFEIDYKLGNEGDPITVILRSKQSTEFRGFILQARKPGSDVPVGKFIALESHSARLLRCNGAADSAVSQRNDQRKTLFRVNWTSPEIDDGIFFRVTFVEYYNTFWRPVDKEIPIITTPSTTTSTEPSTTTGTEPSTTTSTEPSTTTGTEPSTTTSTEPSTTTGTEPSTTASTEPSTTTSTEPSTSTSTEPNTTTSTEPSTTTSTELSTTTSTTPSTTTTSEPSNTTSPMPTEAPKTFGIGLLAMIAGSSTGGVKMALHTIFDTLPNNPFSRRLNRVSKITWSLLCAAVEFLTLVLFCVAEHINITLITLVCMAIVINFVELVILCLPIGPSHELKEICDITVKVCSVIHQIFTIAVIFVGVMETENCRIGIRISYRKHSWLLKVMVAYTVWILLFVIWDFIISTQRTAILGRSKIGSPKCWKQQRKETLRAAEGIVIAVSVILLVGNLCFAVVVAVGLFKCQEK